MLRAHRAALSNSAPWAAHGARDLRKGLGAAVARSPFLKLFSEGEDEHVKT